MKKKIPLQSTAAPDFSSLVPTDVRAMNAPPPAQSSGLDLHNLSAEQANSVPDSGTGEIGFRVHRRNSETKIHPDTGEKTENHSVHMHVDHFHPAEGSPIKHKKKLSESSDAGEAVRDAMPMET